MTGALSFGGNDLQTYDPATDTGIITNSIEHTDLPAKDVQLYALANASVIPNVSHPNKAITLGGVIKGDSQTDLDNRIDSFKAYFNGKDKNLDIDYAGTTRRYIATANAIQITRQQKALWASFTVTIVCSQPFGRNITPTTALSASGRTDDTYDTDTHTFVGTAPLQLPVVTITLTALTGGTAKDVIFGNVLTGQQITVNRTWVANDVLVIDNVLRKVMVNDVEVAFTGAFPDFLPGLGTFYYNDTLTTRTFDIEIEYYPLYL